MVISTFCIGIILLYSALGVVAPVLLLLARLVQEFSVGGAYSEVVVFMAEHSPNRKRGFMGGWLDFGSIAGFMLGESVVVLAPNIVREGASLIGAGMPFIATPLSIIGIYLRHFLEEIPTFQQHISTMDKDYRNAIKNLTKILFINITMKD